jgi:flagellar biosynthesis anti-sigma factor FlgM
VAINLYSTSTTDPTSQLDSISVGKPVAANSHTAAATTATPEDTTAFSSGNSNVQSLTQTALAVVPSRQDKVEALKLAVNTAQYQLDADKIAASLASADI